MLEFNQGSANTSSAYNLQRLLVLRSLTIAGILGAITVIHFFTGVPLPMSPLVAIIGTLLLVNLLTGWRIRHAARISDMEFFAQLVADVAALTGVLYFTGGASNPFAWFFLLPLIIAATVLSARATWLMAALTTFCYSLLMFRFQPLGGIGHVHEDQSFTFHVFGMWFGFMLSAALIAWFVVGMANAVRQRDRLLAQAREKALRDEQLVALGTLATGAAHELGTPLATMAVVVRELQRNTEDTGPVRPRLKVLGDQINRCKEALSLISASAGQPRAEAGGIVAVADFLDQTVQQWQLLRPEAILETDFRDDSAEARILNERTLQQALINLLNNAADVSPQHLRLEVQWDDQNLELDLLDRGPGIQSDAIATLGQRQNSNKDGGMGLGLFLTHATLQRLGGHIELFQREGGGTRMHIRLPLEKADSP